MSPPIAAALGAALLFGASVPLAKPFATQLSPFLLAGGLYLGSGLGIFLLRTVRDRGWKPSGLASRDRAWFLAAVLVGGIAGPVLLMAGLSSVDAGTASLLLNVEALFTALIAWLAFRENAGRRVVFGMLLIVLGGLVLSWPGRGSYDAGIGSLAIVAACLCWGVDNNLTRKVSGADALFLAAAKGAIAGVVNTAIGVALGGNWPGWTIATPVLMIGFVGYGASLVFFVIALRGLGTARTGAYFSTAPFAGAALAIFVFGESTRAEFWAAAALMAGGVWLHLTERHDHAHGHQPLMHEHPHVHDEHHRHEHEAGWDGVEPHTHAHRHEPLRHSHPHFPDLHHRHPHGNGT